MEELQRELFRTFLSFKRLHISRILPGINMGDFTTLKTLKKLEHPVRDTECKADRGDGESTETKTKIEIKAETKTEIRGKAERETQTGSMAEGVRVSAIVEDLDIPAPAVSRSLRNLEEKDYVVRYVNKKDRRNTYVEITPEGEAILEESERIISDFCNAVFHQVGEEDIQRLISYFTKLRNVTEEEIQNRTYPKEQKGTGET